MLTDIEIQIKDYIDHFYDTNDLLKIINIPKIHIKNDTSINDLEYNSICNKIFTLLNNSQLADKYRIEIDKSCTSLIEKLFKAYVDEDTFIITSDFDHEATTSQLGNNKRHIVRVFDTFKDEIGVCNEIVKSFKDSKCKRIFCIMVGTTPQSGIMINQSFFVNLKNALVKQNIDHMMILDDCQDMFMVERNYDIFDGILATSHVLSCFLPNFGILFTKLPKNIGYLNKMSLINAYPTLELLDKYKDKASKFNNLLNDYFKDTMERTGFKQFPNEVSHQFVIWLPKTINNLKYDDEFAKYGFRFDPTKVENNFIRVRYHETIVQDSNSFIEGLRKVKKHLFKLHRFKEFSSDYDFVEDHVTQRTKEGNRDLTPELSPFITQLLNKRQMEFIYQHFLLSGRTH